MKIKSFIDLPGHAARSGGVDHIIIHHMGGNLSLDSCYNALKNGGSSCTYAIDSKGNVGQFLSEALEPYTTSDRYIDDRAITIEVANDGGAPNWHVSEKAIKSLIELLADVCKRNKIKKLSYTGDRKGNLEKHSYYAATACPGPYLGGKFKYIQDEVNKKLNVNFIEYKKHYEILCDLTVSKHKPNGYNHYLVKYIEKRDIFDAKTGKLDTAKFEVGDEQQVYTKAGHRTASGNMKHYFTSDNGREYYCVSATKK